MIELPQCELPDSVDVVVVGSGAAALATAVACAAKGLSAIVLEKDRYFGGTSAFSGAAMWLPLTEKARAAGSTDSRAAVLEYLDTLVGNLASVDLRTAFIDHTGEALAFFEENSELRYDLRGVAADYHLELPGSVTAGRVLDVRIFDGRRLGVRLHDMRPPLESHLVFGGMMVNRQDVQMLMKVGRDTAATLHCIKLLARYAYDRLRYGRSTRLVLGSALVARLAASLFTRGVPLVVNCPVTQLVEGSDGRVVGVRARPNNGAERQILARRGVVLATGGFARNDTLSAANRPNPEATHFSMLPDSVTGDGIGLGEAHGATFAAAGADAFFWAPLSVLRQPGGKIRKFAHLTLDRAKPGVLAIDRTGRRFVNEADSYHRFGKALHALPAAGDNAPSAWLVCDARALRAYGLGLARPVPAHRGNRALIKAGYLIEADSLESLASRLGVPTATLAETVAAANSDSLAGNDRAFGKGGSAHNRPLGDPAIKPNPCLAPLVEAPFYAVGIYSGDLGTARGLATDRRARALDADGTPVPGLYAVGNDMHSIMGGTYPGGGITLGPALVFAYLAANDLAGTPVV